MKDQVEFDKVVRALTQKVKSGDEWKINLSGQLQRYKDYAQHSDFGEGANSKEPGRLYGSFVEAGLVVENASSIYSLRVDSAYESIVKCAQSLTKCILNLEKPQAEIAPSPKEPGVEKKKVSKVMHKEKAKNDSTANNFNLLQQMNNVNIKTDSEKRVISEDRMISGHKFIPLYLNKKNQEKKTEIIPSNTEILNSFNEVTSHKYDYMMNTSILMDYEYMSDDNCEVEESDQTEPERRQSCSAESVISSSLVDSGVGSSCSASIITDKQDTLKEIFQEFLSYLDDTINNVLTSNIASHADVNHLIQSVNPIRKNLEILIGNSKEICGNQSKDNFSVLQDSQSNKILHEKSLSNELLINSTNHKKDDTVTTLINTNTVISNQGLSKADTDKDLSNESKDSQQTQPVNNSTNVSSQELQKENPIETEKQIQLQNQMDGEKPAAIKQTQIETEKTASEKQTQLSGEMETGKPSADKQSQLKSQMETDKPATVKENQLQSQMEIEKPAADKQTQLQNQIETEKPSAEKTTPVQTQLLNNNDESNKNTTKTTQDSSVIETNKDKEINLLKLDLSILTTEQDFDYSQGVFKDETVGFLKLPMHVLHKIEFFSYSEGTNLKRKRKLAEPIDLNKNVEKMIKTNNNTRITAKKTIDCVTKNKSANNHLDSNSNKEYSDNNASSLKSTNIDENKNKQSSDKSTSTMKSIDTDATVNKQNSNDFANNAIPVNKELSESAENDLGEQNKKPGDSAICAETVSKIVSNAEKSVASEVAETACRNNNDSGLTEEDNLLSVTPLNEILPQLKPVSMLNRLDKDLNEMILNRKQSVDQGFVSMEYSSSALELFENGLSYDLSKPIRDSGHFSDEGFDDTCSILSDHNSSMIDIYGGLSGEVSMLDFSTNSITSSQVGATSTPHKNVQSKEVNDVSHASKNSITNLTDSVQNKAFFERPKSLKEKYCVQDSGIDNRMQQWREMINLNLEDEKHNIYELKTYKTFLLYCLSKTKNKQGTLGQFISCNPDIGNGRFLLAALQLINEKKLEMWETDVKEFDDPNKMSLKLREHFSKNQAGPSGMQKSRER